MRVLVVGGGVIGASVAYHLAARGVREIVVLDRAAGPGEGSTGRATGGFRAQFSTAINIRLSLLSRAKLLRFEDELGADPGYERRGYLWLASTEADLAALDEGRALQNREGLTEATLITAGDVARLNPGIDCAGLLGGAFCPTDGFIRPLAILAGYLDAAARLGVRVEWGSEVVAIERAGERITAVRTARERFTVDAVVNAAGAWARALAAMAGVDIPVTPLRRQILPTEPQTALPREMPMTIFADGFHLRVRDGRALLLWPDPAPEGFDTAVDPAWLDAVEEMTRRRVPALASVAIDRAGAWAGLYEMTPDRHALVGSVPGCHNFYLANGSSGHGVMHAPALGQLVAELVCGEHPSLDLARLAPDRFTDGGPASPLDL